MWMPSVLTVFSLRTFTREVKVVQSYINKKLKHSSLPSVCIGDNHGTVLEQLIIYHNLLYTGRTLIQPTWIQAGCSTVALSLTIYFYNPYSIIRLDSHISTLIPQPGQGPTSAYIDRYNFT